MKTIFVELTGVSALLMHAFPMQPIAQALALHRQISTEERGEPGFPRARE